MISPASQPGVGVLEFLGSPVIERKVRDNPAQHPARPRLYLQIHHRDIGRSDPAGGRKDGKFGRHTGGFSQHPGELICLAHEIEERGPNDLPRVAPDKVGETPVAVENGPVAAQGKRPLPHLFHQHTVGALGVFPGRG
jgi:hypothetical protein